MNKFFKDRAIGEIRSMIASYESSSRINHPGIKGRAREDALLTEILKMFLPFGIDLCTDQTVVDCEGGQSREIDGIVYTKKVLPSLVFSQNSLFIPIESVIYTFEMKSTASNKEIKDAFKKAISVRNLVNTPDFTGVGDSMAFFSYKSDIKGDPQKEFERFINNQNDFWENPLIPAICIIGRGYWYNESKSKKWYFVKSSNNFDEVIAFLAHVINSVITRMEMKTPCPFGPYITEDIAKELNRPT